MAFVRTLILIVVLLLGWAVLRSEGHILAFTPPLSAETVLG